MKTSRRARGLLRRPVSLAAAVMAFVLLPGPGAGTPRSAELRRAGYELAYNLDFGEAMAVLRRAVDADPDDPASHRAVAAVTWLNMLLARGALSSDEYLSSIPESSTGTAPPPADQAAAFLTSVERAIELAEALLRRRPRDADAAFELGAARGLLAAYTVTIEGSLVRAVTLARSAYKAQEHVLALDPARKDAAFITGSYRYAVANLGSVKRWLAYLAGFGGGRDTAIRMLEECAAHPSDVQADAKVLLVLVYNRERRYDDALRELADLRQRFPRNRLLWLESGAAEMRAGRPERALAFLDAGLAMFGRDARPKSFGESALWHYKRGAARAALGDRAGAEADLRHALAGDGRGWVHGRCRIELGKLADLAGDRTAAVAEYRKAAALCGGDRDPVGLADAEQLAKQPYTGTKVASGRQSR